MIPKMIPIAGDDLLNPIMLPIMITRDVRSNTPNLSVVPPEPVSYTHLTLPTIYSV